MMSLISMSHQFDSKKFLQRVPVEPGVYRMFDDQDQVIYVGKAKQLKKRLSSYFLRQNLDIKTQALVKHIVKIEYTVVHSETDALLLENNYIKQLRPKYNVLLRDDKSYPYIFLSGHKHPRLAYHRGAQRQKGEYFGPYPNASAVRESLHLMQKLFPIRQCEDSFYRARSRPCLQYQIERCLAPCVSGYVSDEDYLEQVRLASLFLKGKNSHVIDELVSHMEQASEQQHYEYAAKLRDQISALTKVVEQQEVSRQAGDMDVIGVAYEHGIACIHVLFIRQGKIFGHRGYHPKVPNHSQLEEVLRAFILQFYFNEKLRQDFPKEIIVSHDFSDSTLFIDCLNEKLPNKVALKTKVRGDRANFLRISLTNAQHSVENQLAQKTTIEQRMRILEQELDVLNPIQRMECFDISHTQGEATVASCVVFHADGPATDHYRRFNIKGIQGGDDYAAMRQALQRRFKTHEHIPDVLFIDGGLGQLHIAEEVIAELIPTVEDRPLLVGVAKGEGRKAGLEKLILGESHDVIRLRSDSPALHLIQHIRDESHRFAITGHRAQRQKARKHSTLEDIPGVGPKKRKQLLQYLGGLQEVRKASVSQLAQVPNIGEDLAQIIYDALRG